MPPYWIPARGPQTVAMLSAVERLMYAPVLQGRWPGRRSIVDIFLVPPKNRFIR